MAYAEEDFAVIKSLFYSHSILIVNDQSSEAHGFLISQEHFLLYINDLVGNIVMSQRWPRSW